jgi:hypothetical protein
MQFLKKRKIDFGKLNSNKGRELMKWITRERPKIDRIACPWLIRKFVDKEAEFLYVPSTDVMRVANDTGAIPYDVPGVELTHVGPECSFDAFIKKYKIAHAALATLADIVRAADTDNLAQSEQAAGLLAITLGLSKNIKDDQEMLKVGIVIYDALYSWCESLSQERHSWNPGEIKL